MFYPWPWHWKFCQLLPIHKARTVNFTLRQLCDDKLTPPISYFHPWNTPGSSSHSWRCRQIPLTNFIFVVNCSWVLSLPAVGFAHSFWGICRKILSPIFQLEAMQLLPHPSPTQIPRKQLELLSTNLGQACLGCLGRFDMATVSQCCFAQALKHLNHKTALITQYFFPFSFWNFRIPMFEATP